MVERWRLVGQHVEHLRRRLHDSPPRRRDADLGDTGTGLDPRNNTRGDALWDQASGKLYVASHVYSSSGSSTTAANSARLYRYTYSASTDQYTLDTGFPVTINSARSESLVVDRDSTGQLWITWVQSNQVWVNRSLCNPTCNDAAWGTPFVPAVNATYPGSTTVGSDDISSLISFGSRVGVMWSNQAQSAWYFAVHDDSADDTTWGASRQAFQGVNEADDHIHLATLLSGGDGRVFVAVKTSLNSSNQPAIKILERLPLTGAWVEPHRLHGPIRPDTTDRPYRRQRVGAPCLQLGRERGRCLPQGDAALQRLLRRWQGHARDVDEARRSSMTPAPRSRT